MAHWSLDLGASWLNAAGQRVFPDDSGVHPSTVSHLIGVASAAAPAADFRTKRWVRLVGVCDCSSAEGALRLYVDGERQAEARYQDTMAALPDHLGGRLTIGAAMAGGNETDWFVGQIMDASVYQVALTADQIRTLYRSG